MTLRGDLDADVAKTIRTSLSTTERNDGTITSVPDPEKMGYSDGIYLPSTYLYADMADSSGLVTVAPATTVAQAMRSYLSVCTRIIRAHDGHIRSFDGDRVMGIYAGPNRADRAVKSAMQIKWAIANVVQPSLEKQFKSIRESSWKMGHACGIASGKALLVRAGFRGSDDLVSIGTPPNLAAKLSDKREDRFKTFIGGGTYKMLSDSGRLSSGNNMWTGPYDFNMGRKIYKYYKSSYHWSI